MNDDLLKTITSDQFKALGLNQIAYVKSIDAKGPSTSYVVHAADGSQLFKADRLEAVIGRLHDRSMFAVTLH